MRPMAKWRAIAWLFVYLALDAAALQAEWTKDGVGITTTSYSKNFPRIVSDGYQGAIVAWTESRSGSSWDIYAQRVYANGDVLWGSQGIVVCGLGVAQTYPLMVPDGAGGAIISWQDLRNGNYDIYVQRIDENGAGQWAANGTALCTMAGDQYNNGIVSDGAGGAIVAFVDVGGAGDVYVQRIASDGTILWATNGVAVCATSDGEGTPQIASDGAHGAIVALVRNILGQTDVIANRVDAAGAVRWIAAGVPLCTAAGGESIPKVIYNGSGGAIVTWEDGRNFPQDIYAQLVDTTGTVLWGATGAAICTAADAQKDAQIVPDGAGGAIIAWSDSRTGTSDIYAQRIAASGAVLWPSNGIAVCAAADVQDQCKMDADGAGGAVLAWRDLRAGNGDYNIYTHRIDENGAPIWMVNGEVACAATGAQRVPAVACDGVWGSVTAWLDDRSGSNAIYAHRGNPIVATLLQNFAAGIEGGCVELSWALSEAGIDVRFFVERALGPDREFEEIVNPGIARSGLSFSFVDCSVAPGDPARYRVAVEDNGDRRFLFETDAVVIPPATLVLFQNRPNPFNPSTTIGYYLPAAAHVTLEIYDPAGREIARLVDAVQAKGNHEAGWNGRNGAGAMAGSGVYFYRLTVGKETLTKKMVLLR